MIGQCLPRLSAWCKGPKPLEAEDCFPNLCVYKLGNCEKCQLTKHIALWLNPLGFAILLIKIILMFFCSVCQVFMLPTPRVIRSVFVFDEMLPNSCVFCPPADLFSSLPFQNGLLNYEGFQT